jgi:carbon-monoxide dehydrogenase medium subunit
VGSLCHFDAASEQPLMACLHDARFEVRSHRGTRHLEFDEFGLGYMTNALEPDELVVGVTLKPWPAAAGCAFEEFARRRGDFAIAGCGVLVQLTTDGRIDRLAIGLCGIGATPVRLRESERIAVGCASQESLLAAIRQELDTLSLTDDSNATAAYRRRLAESLAGRALARAFDDCLQRRSIA